MFIIKVFLCIVVTAGSCNTASCNEACHGALNITLSHSEMLDPISKFGSGIMYEPAKIDPSVIILHYTVTPNVDQTVNAFYRRGVSSHYTIARNGTIYKHVPDGNIAYHAGLSFWGGQYNLNYYSKGIEHINEGWNVDTQSWPFEEADGKNWEKWPESSIESSAKLIKLLCEKYNIKPWNIIAHSDCSCGRKVDPGPLFPWKKLHDEYDIGFWPDDDATITKELADKLNDKDYMLLLHVFGYPVKKNFLSSIENTEELKTKLWGKERAEIGINGIKSMSNNLKDYATISAFQYHYMQDKFENDPKYRSGNLDNETRLMILRCIKSIIKAVDENDHSSRMLEEALENGLSENVRSLIYELNPDICY